MENNTLQAKHDLIIEALAYFEKMYLSATSAKNRKVQLNNVQACKNEYVDFCKQNPNFQPLVNNNTSI